MLANTDVIDIELTLNGYGRKGKRQAVFDFLYRITDVVDVSFPFQA